MCIIKQQFTGTVSFSKFRSQILFDYSFRGYKNTTYLFSQSISCPTAGFLKLNTNFENIIAKTGNARISLSRRTARNYIRYYSV